MKIPVNFINGVSDKYLITDDGIDFYFKYYGFIGHVQKRTEDMYIIEYESMKYTSTIFLDISAIKEMIDGDLELLYEGL